jgi:hypothetical protein
MIFAVCVNNSLNTTLTKTIYVDPVLTRAAMSSSNLLSRFLPSILSSRSSWNASGRFSHFLSWNQCYASQFSQNFWVKSMLFRHRNVSSANKFADNVLSVPTFYRSVIWALERFNSSPDNSSPQANIGPT